MRPASRAPVRRGPPSRSSGRGYQTHVLDCGSVVTSISGSPYRPPREVRVCAVDGGLVTFAGGKKPGMLCSCVQPLRVMWPYARKAVKRVGNPVLCLGDGGCRSRYLLPEAYCSEPSPSRALVIDPVPVPHWSLLKCARLEAWLSQA